MPQLIQIKDVRFLTLKDDVKVTDKDKKSFLSMDLKDDFFSPKVIDVPTSLALLAEFDKCPFTDSNFMNDLNTEMPSISHKDDYVYIGPSYSVKSERIPLLMKKAGLKIQRKQLIAYIAPYDNPETPYVLVKQDGTPFESEDQPNNRANQMNIEIYDDVLALRKEEYNRYMQAEELISSGKYNEVSKQDLYLWALTDTFIKRREKQDVVFHEMRHARNSLVLFDYLFDNPDCKLSALDVLKLERDDELSAKIAEAIEAINTYNTSENKDDLSVFESSYLLQQLLYDNSIEERKRLLSDIPSIIREVCTYWYKNFLIAYRPQFIRNLSVKLNQLPLKHLAHESDSTTYNYIRKIMFTYNVYDPKTDKYVNVDLSKYVFDLGVEESILKMVQQMYQDIVVKRQDVLKERHDKIQYGLIDQATEEHKNCVINTEYRKTLTELQMRGMDYMSALNFVPGVTDLQEKIKSIPTQAVIQQPTATTKKERTETKSEKNDNIFKRVIREINRRILLRQYQKKGDNGIDYE